MGGRKCFNQVYGDGLQLGQRILSEGRSFNESRKPVFFQPGLRNWVFVRAYDKTGSLNALARELGYKAKGKHGLVRDFWLGRLGVPERKVPGLCHLASVDLTWAHSLTVDKKLNLEQTDWTPIALLYAKDRDISFDDFRLQVESLVRFNAIQSRIT